MKQIRSKLDSFMQLISLRQVRLVKKENTCDVLVGSGVGGKTSVSEEKLYA